MQRYLYPLKLMPIEYAGMLFFAGCLGGFIKLVRKNHSGLIINHVIELDVGGATVFYGVMAVLSFAFLAAIFASFFQRAGKPRYLELSDEGIRVPKRWSQGVLCIRYDEIRELLRQDVSGQHFLYVKGEQKKVTIAAIMLESKAVFEQVCREIEARVQALHRGADDADDD